MPLLKVMPSIVGRAITWRHLRSAIVTLSVAALFLPAPAASDESKSLDARACSEAGRWLDPKSGEFIKRDALMERLSKKSIVLLGESHTSREHHLWQSQMLSALYARQRSFVVGFEMFPRAVQGVLDQWSRGELSRDSFLKATRWHEVWGYDPDFYMPLFDFVRQNRLAMIGINVDRRLVSSVAEKGWDAVPADLREGVSKPAPASEGYRTALAEIFAVKLKYRDAPPTQHSIPQSAEQEAEPTEADLAAIKAREDFGRFVEAQLTWDRAMAEALAAARKANPAAQVVGVLGRGHAEHGYGVPHQLRDLGIEDVSVLLPVEVGEACEHAAATVSEALFLVDRPSADAHPPEKPKLGITIETADDGVRITGIVDGSVAQAAELAEGDIIVSAAGTPVRRNVDIIAIVQRQAPGTWLPIRIRRNGEELPIVAKFPTEAATPR